MIGHTIAVYVPFIGYFNTYQVPFIVYTLYLFFWLLQHVPFLGYTLYLFRLLQHVPFIGYTLYHFSATERNTAVRTRRKKVFMGAPEKLFFLFRGVLWCVPRETFI